VQKLVGYFEHGRPALKTYTNRRGIVSTFLKFAFLRGWVAENPILKCRSKRIRRRRGMAATLSATQARELMEHMENYEGGRGALFRALPFAASGLPCHTGDTKLSPRQLIWMRLISCPRSLEGPRTAQGGYSAKNLQPGH